MFIPGVTAGGHKYAPVVSTNTIVPVPTEYTQLTFSGQIVRAGNSNNTVVFHYGTSPTLATYSTTTPAATVTNGTNSLNVTFTQTGLNSDNSGVTYYYRIVSTNLGGTVLGDIKQATVPVRVSDVATSAGSDATIVPTSVTGAATNISYTSATLNGTATNATSSYFQYSTDSLMAGAVNTANAASPTVPSVGISSLSPNTPYYYRLVSTNTVTRATFNGLVNPQNRSTTTLFRYATTLVGVAGSATTIAGNTPVTNTTDQVITATATLAAGTYYFRIEATNAGGTSVGSIQQVTISSKTTTSSTIISFTTLSLADVSTTPGADATLPPNPVTAAVTNVGESSATFNGNSTNTTSCYFEYSTDPAMAGASSTGIPASLVTPSISQTFLNTGTTYHYRLISINSTTRATFNGSVNPRNSATTTLFRYATSAGGVATSTTTIAGTTPVTNNSAQAITATLTLPAGTYYYQIEATTTAANTTVLGGIVSLTIEPETTISSTVISFTTLTVPIVITTTGTDSTATPVPTATQFTNVNKDSATLNGTATNATSSYFQYSPDSFATSQDTVPAASPTAPSVGISDLSPDTPYSYRLVSRNTTTRATFNGTVNPQNRATTTLFRYSTDSSLITNGTAPTIAGTTPAGNPPTTNNSVQDITALATLPAGNYYYRMEATSASGTIIVGTIIGPINVAATSVTSAIGPSFRTYVYRSQTFLTSGTWTRPSVSAGYLPITSVTVDALGGGGGGGRGYFTDGVFSRGTGAGGGGGGQRVIATSAVSGNLTVSVGAGGTKASMANAFYSGQPGDPSSAGSVSAAGGTGGLGYFATNTDGGTSGSGYAGGTGNQNLSSGWSIGGGGGGSNGSGGNASTTVAGVGGQGTDTYWGGGGGGAGEYYDAGYVGYVGTIGAGSNGGTNGGIDSAANAPANSGAGGGGSTRGSGGQGGSGFVTIFWYGP